MTIDKILKAYNFKANPKYLRKDFIVPLFTGTELEIEPEKLEEHLKNEKNKNNREKE
jgi:hypothetical protein